jgi:hypothetical protein
MDNMPDWTPEYQWNNQTSKKAGWFEKEMSNNVGFTVMIRDYDGDVAHGRIMSVHEGGVLLQGKNERMFCMLDNVAFYCIYKDKRKARRKK